jgi:hypothetical protein
MDAFEQIVAELLLAEGYWVETSFKVDLTKDEKVRIGRHSTPRWEIDVLAYRPASEELLAVECKSFLDSTGVQWAELQEGHASERYKLFREPVTREVVLNRLRLQLVEAGRCRGDVSVRLALAAGKIKRGDAERVRAHMRDRGWAFFEPDWLRDRLKDQARKGYANQVSSVVAKLLLRNDLALDTPGEVSKAPDLRRLVVLATSNPKKPGSQAHARFSLYSNLKQFTVQEALGLGVRRDDLVNDERKGFISIG